LDVVSSLLVVPKPGVGRWLDLDSATGRTLQRQERYTTPIEKAKKWSKSGIKQVPVLISELFWDKNYKNDSFFVRKHSKITGHAGC
jgi:hypothetical protein